MAELPAMPLWTDAYLGDTTHLSTTEHGAYLLLLIAGWRRGGWLPDDDKQLAKIAGLSPANWSRMKTTIRAFFFERDGKLHQRRQLDELEYVKASRQRQSAKANQRWDKHRRNQPELPLGDGSENTHSDASNSSDTASNHSEAKSLKTNDAPDATAMPRQCTHTHTHTQEEKELPNGSSKNDDEGLFDIPKARRSRRCPSSFTPSVDELDDKTRAKVETWEPDEFDAECDKFLNHEFGTPRSDWRATFRNWCITHHGDRKTRRGGYERPSGHTVPKLGAVNDTTPPGMEWDDVFGCWMPIETDQRLLGGPTE